MSGGGCRAILTGMEIGAHSAPEGGFLIPCLLLMMRETPREAAELRELLGAFGFHRRVPALAATLQALEADMLVWSADHADADGSIRSRYRLTAGGEQWLTVRAGLLAEPARLLGRFLDGYASLATPTAAGEASATGMPGRSRPSTDAASAT